MNAELAELRAEAIAEFESQQPMLGFKWSKVVDPSKGQRPELKRLDKVRLNNGNVLIVTGYHPNRPENCWSGVKERGQGAEYIFGMKFNPVKIGEVTEDHPMLAMLAGRKAQKSGRTAFEAAEPVKSALVSGLVAAVLANDFKNAKELAVKIRLMEGG